jgi:[acyl-carrier-protein] S-malonyltransferase
MSLLWLFPGQGSQFVGMGKATVEASPAARDVWRRVDEALGEKFFDLVMTGPEDKLSLTANTQPAIVATSCAVLAALRERNPQLPLPRFAAGHSLGEYSALVAAGSLQVEDAVRLVRARGQAMQEAVPAGVGAMAAIMALDPDAVIALCQEAEAAGPAGEVVRPANFNAPGQIVIAGHADAVTRARELAGAKGGKAIALKVSAPFHCPLMIPAARALEEKLADITFAPLAFPIVSNVDALPNQDASKVKERLIRQVDGPVLWEQSLRRMCEGAEAPLRALEIGPGKVLTGLAKRTVKELEVLPVCDPAQIEQAAAARDNG